ncbi:MAG: hypothetical protein AMXMBFR59_42770 [Rhodanobacteraceae bacterium]
MKRCVSLMFNGSTRPANQNAELLRGFGVDETAITAQRHPFYDIEFEESDGRLSRMLEGLGRLRQSYIRKVWIEYDRHDLDAAPLLWLRQASKTRGSPQPYSQYDLSAACPRCGTGAQLIGAMQIKANELSKKGGLQQCHTGEVIISESLAQAVKEETGSSIDFRPVEEYGTEVALPWRHIVPQFVLPPFARETTGVLRERACPSCNRDGYFGNIEVPFQPVFRQHDFRELQCWPRMEGAAPPDFARTWECYGNSSLNLDNDPVKTIGFAQPLIFVSNRVMRTVLRNKVRGFDFVPIRLL